MFSIIHSGLIDMTCFPHWLDPGAERFRISFTLRDSPSDYINVTCWGSEQYIRGIADSFKICDVGEWILCTVDRADVHIVPGLIEHRGLS